MEPTKLTVAPVPHPKYGALTATVLCRRKLDMAGRESPSDALDVAIRDTKGNVIHDDFVFVVNRSDTDFRLGININGSRVSYWVVGLPSCLHAYERRHPFPNEEVEQARTKNVLLLAGSHPEHSTIEPIVTNCSEKNGRMKLTVDVYAEWFGWLARGLQIEVTASPTEYRLVVDQGDVTHFLLKDERNGTLFDLN